jgi:hypothetical protein
MRQREMQQELQHVLQHVFKEKIRRLTEFNSQISSLEQPTEVNSLNGNLGINKKVTKVTPDLQNEPDFSGH